MRLTGRSSRSAPVRGRSRSPGRPSRVFTVVIRLVGKHNRALFRCRIFHGPRRCRPDGSRRLLRQSPHEGDTVDFLRPATLAEALALKAERPDAVPIAGGTDVMVELNFDHRRPGALLDLTTVGELAEWSTSDGTVRLGAGVPYSRVIAELGESVPALAMASRTVGSPQIRNRGTVGGNLGAASPAGDTHPVLLVLDARIEAASVRGARLLRAEEVYVGVKRHALAPDELITAVHLPAHAGPQQFAKVGTRNAMVIAVCSFALSLRDGRVGAAIG